MQDIAGIDVGARIRQYLASIGKSRAEGPQSAIPDRLFEMGRYGQKTGAGWYQYDAPGSRNRTTDPLIEELANEEAKKRGIVRRPISDEEIIARITTALANEGARVLEDKFATRPGDIDIIYVYGFGFPRQRGGPMFYADTVGLPTVLSRVKEYRARFGDYWEPAPMLEKLAARRSRVLPMMGVTLDVRTLGNRIGEEIAVSNWMEVTQERINQFADATGDHQWIHVDRARAAAELPSKTTIAHGFLTLSLLSTLIRESITFTGLRMAINYGLNRVRFVSPVPSGSRIRALITLQSVDAVSGGYQVTWQVDRRARRRRQTRLRRGLDRPLLPDVGLRAQGSGLRAEGKG